MITTSFFCHIRAIFPFLYLIQKFQICVSQAVFHQLILPLITNMLSEAKEFL